MGQTKVPQPPITRFRTDLADRATCRRAGPFSDTAEVIGIIGGELEPVWLVAGSAQSNPAIWHSYRAGLVAAYLAIGAGQMAPPGEVPAIATTVVLAVGSDGEVVGGFRLRAEADLSDYEGLGLLAEAISARETEGLNEVKGLWVHPAARGRGLGVELARAVVGLAARAGHRFTVGFANPNGLRALEGAGFVRDNRFLAVPFPSEELPSTLAWFDHRGLTSDRTAS